MKISKFSKEICTFMNYICTNSYEAYSYFSHMNSQQVKAKLSGHKISILLILAKKESLRSDATSDAASDNSVNS